MYRTAIALLVTGSTLWISCNKIKDQQSVTEEMRYQNAVYLPDIPTSTPVPSNGLRVACTPITFLPETEKKFEEFNTSPRLVNGITVKAGGIGMISPPDGSFNFLDSVGVYLHSSNLPPVLIAYQNNIPANKKNFDLSSTGRDLKAYLLEDTLKMTLTVTYDSIPRPGVYVDITSVFEVKGGILN